MNKKHYKRLCSTLWVTVLLVISAYFFIDAISSGMHFYADPSDVGTRSVSHIGGKVKEGSIQRKDNHYLFQVYDQNNTIQVSFDGTLPPLFKEDRMVVLIGGMQDDTFVAKRVYAKHDEYYRSGVES